MVDLMSPQSSLAGSTPGALIWHDMVGSTDPPCGKGLRRRQQLRPRLPALDRHGTGCLPQPVARPTGQMFEPARLIQRLIGVAMWREMVGTDPMSQDYI